LERLGWRYHRIWTADWYLDPKRQIEFVKNSFHQALIDGPSLNVNIAPVRESKKVIARGPRPPLPEYDDIGDIPYEALADLVAWIESDGLNRTEDELVAETVEELGFQRRGSRIVEAVLHARRLNALEGQ
jgi:hypothetical protein